MLTCPETFLWWCCICATKTVPTQTVSYSCGRKQTTAIRKSKASVACFVLNPQRGHCNNMTLQLVVHLTLKPQKAITLGLQDYLQENHTTGRKRSASQLERDGPVRKSPLCCV